MDQIKDFVSDFVRHDVKTERRGNILFDADWAAIGVTDQFIENADTYHERYFDRLDFIELSEIILSLAEISRDKPIQCLDIGSGSGCSVLATAKLLPNANIIASDISPQLLNILGGYVSKSDELKNRVSLYCFDLHKPFFKNASFDLIIGTAILHHLLDPYEALKNIVLSIKEGGKIVVVEPLEAGQLILSILYDRVLVVLRKIGEENGTLAKLMHAMRLDIRARLGVPVAQAWSPHLDDKWVFNEDYINELSRQLGMSRVDIYPGQRSLGNIFESTFKSLLNESGNSELNIPPGVLEVFQDFDAGISPALKNIICPTGIIVFTK